MPDKVTTPGTEAAASAETEQTVQAGQAATPAPAPDVTALQQELERERKQRIEAERSYNNLRPKLNEHDQELAQLRALRDSVFTAGQGGDSAEPAPMNPELASEIHATREEVAWMRFQQNHPKYAEYWDEMKAVARDSRTKETVESFRIFNGKPVLNTFATLHNAYNEVALQRVEKAQATTATRQAEADASRKKLTSQAVISGDGAGSAAQGGLESLTLEQIMAMDYNELIKHVPVDPNDPPRGL